MLKKILDFKGVKVLSKDQMLNITGKGDVEVHPQCDRYAPIDANPLDYPYYPCATPPLAPIGCTVTIDGVIC